MTLLSLWTSCTVRQLARRKGPNNHRESSSAPTDIHCLVILHRNPTSLKSQSQDTISFAQCFIFKQLAKCLEREHTFNKYSCKGKRKGVKGKWNWYYYTHLKIFLMFIFERERQKVSGGGPKRERETQNPKQPSGSELSAQSPMRGSNSQTAWDHDLRRNWTFNWLSHPCTPIIILTLKMKKVK